MGAKYVQRTLRKQRSRTISVAGVMNETSQCGEHSMRKSIRWMTNTDEGTSADNSMSFENWMFLCWAKIARALARLLNYYVYMSSVVISSTSHII